jgi:hypothetical protein
MKIFLKGEIKMSEKKNMSIDIENLFEGFIKPGLLIKEEEVAPGWKIKLKPLSAGDMIQAEMNITIKNPYILPDTIVKVRSASILSYAILAINDLNIESDTEEATNARRSALFDQLLKLPGILIEKMYDFYVKVVNEQNKAYENKELAKDIENF